MSIFSERRASWQDARVPDDCIFCAIARGDAPSFRVDEDEHTVAFMDIQPWRRGHALVIPRRHARDLAEIEPEQLEHVFAAARRLAGRMQERFGADEISLTNSMGSAADQTVFHLHVHVVPELHADIPRTEPPSAGELEEIAALLR
jgi:histidine triad (HIT) family protein